MWLVRGDRRPRAEALATGKDFPYVVMMIHSRLTAKSQTTVPAAVRRALGVKPGDTLTYALEGNRVVLARADTGLGDAMFVGDFSTFNEWDSEADRRALADL